MSPQAQNMGDAKTLAIVERLRNCAANLPYGGAPWAVAPVTEAADTIEQLYEALADVMADLDCLDGDLCPHWVKSHANARAALRKARGESA